jgi:hypothetical protein
MASHYVALAREVEGSKYSDFTTGTSSASTALFEFRVLDGVTPKKVEMHKVLKAFKRFFQNAQQVGVSGFDVSG